MPPSGCSDESLKDWPVFCQLAGLLDALLKEAKASHREFDLNSMKSLVGCTDFKRQQKKLTKCAFININMYCRMGQENITNV